MKNLVGAKFYCSYAPAEGNYHIWIIYKTPDFSSTVLPTYLCTTMMTRTRTSS